MTNIQNGNMSIEQFLLNIFILMLFIDMSPAGVYYIKIISVFLIFVLVALKNKKLLINNIIYIYFVFLILATLSGTYSVRNDYFIGNIFLLLSCFLLLITIPQILNTERKIDNFFNFTILCGLLLSIHVLLTIDINKILQPGYYVSSVLGKSIGNRNSIALLIALACNFLVYKIVYQRKYKFLSILVIMTFAILLTGSRKGLLMCILPLVLNVLFLILKSNSKSKIRYIILFSIILISLLYALFKVDFLYYNIGIRFEYVYEEIILGESSGRGSTSDRRQMIEMGLNYFKERPIFGYGIENFRFLYSDDTGRETYSHNNYIEILTGTGLIGFLLYYGFYMLLIVQANKKRKLTNSNREKDYYLFCITLLLTMLVVDISLVSYKSYVTYIIFALAMKPLFKCEKKFVF